MFFSNLLVPWQETFADAGGGDGGGAFGHNWDHFEIILNPLWINFRTIFGRPYAPPQIKQKSTKINFLEMAHTNFVSSIR